MVQPNITNQINTEMNDVWKDFLVSKVNSLVRWDLMRFFHENPHTADTAENIAFVVGRDKQVTQKALDGLVKGGLLEKKSVSTVAIYTYTSDQTLRQRIQEFVMACHNREFRMKAINHVIQSMRTTAQSA